MFTHRSRISAVAVAAALALSAGALAACDSDDSDAAARADTSQAATHHAPTSDVEAPATDHDATATDQAAPAVDDQASAADQEAPGVDYEARADLRAAMRTLWGQHMTWTWSTVVAFAEESPGLQAQLDRLLANQQDIGDAIAPYYGAEAAQQLTDVLTTHINQAVPVLTAAKNGDDPALQAALDDWYVNARDIADVLSSVNPENWPQEATREMMKAHIDTTVAYASAVLSGDYAAAVAAYDEAEAHMMHLADTLAAGIVAQFPDKI